ncbi:MAG: hypothetical protein ABSH19_02270 [Opitutales bacterium]|jgi:Flp pilus assembly secretin CpaC
MHLQKTYFAVLAVAMLALLAPSLGYAADSSTPSSPQPAKEVEVSATFLEIQQGVVQELGFQWSVTNPAHPNNFINSSTGNLYLLGSPPPSGNASAQPATVAQNTTSSETSQLATGNATSVPQSLPSLPGGINVGAGALAPISVDTFSHTNGYGVQTVINALLQTQGASLMAAPKITVPSGQEAQISTTQPGVQPPNSPYATDPLGVTFTVLPMVNDNGSVDYSIKATITDLVSQQSVSGGDVQHTNVTELVTSGHALNGQTVAFDLTAEPASPPNSTAPGNSTAAATPNRHRYAIFQFHLINSDGSLVSRLAQPPDSTLSSESHATPPPQNSP